jgi:hypothetical protein
VIRLEVSGASYATFREMTAKLRREAGEPLDDDAVVLMMARTVLGGPKDPGRSSHQIKLDVCDKCRRGLQEGKGELIPVAAEVVEMAKCDAQHIGRIASRADTRVGNAAADQSSSSPSPSPKPERATQSPPPAVRRMVLRRDHNRCVVPGCMSGTFLDVHHCDPREEGGDHDPDRLATLCGAHHKAVHAGRIVIKGRASERLEFLHADATPYGGAVSPDVIDLKTKAFQALRGLGFKETEVKRALDSIDTHMGTPTLESLVRQGLSALT